MNLKKRLTARINLLISVFIFCIASLFSMSANAAGKLNVYCSMQNTTCEKMIQVFSQKYQVETTFIRQSTGMTLGKIKAEASNPQADVWYGGTLEPHIQAANLGLLEKYRSPMQEKVLPPFQKIVEKHGDYTSPIYFMELVIGVNRSKLAELKQDKPQCFSELVRPEWRDKIQYADPRVSGTGYSFISTLSSLWGEDKAIDFVKQLHPNIAQYAKSGLAVNMLSTGEVALDIGFKPVYVSEQEKGADIEVVYPCEGVGYSLGAVSIINKARHLDNAKLFVDWTLSAEAQEILWRDANAYTIPTNSEAQTDPKMTSPTGIKLIDIDFSYFGSDKVSKNLIENWTNQILGSNCQTNCDTTK